jgi:hypothetical protein
MKFIFLINLVSCVFMTGLIWCIQVVHYPLFANVGKESFPEYHSLHSIKITYIVLPAMCAEIFTGFLLLGENEYMSSLFSAILFGMILVIWASTFFLQVPIHGEISGGDKGDLINRLVGTNWVRTLFWTGRTVILSHLLFKKL